MNPAGNPYLDDVRVRCDQDQLSKEKCSFPLSASMNIVKVHPKWDERERERERERENHTRCQRLIMSDIEVNDDGTTNART